MHRTFPCAKVSAVAHGAGDCGVLAACAAVVQMSSVNPTRAAKRVFIDNLLQVSATVAACLAYTIDSLWFQSGHKWQGGMYTVDLKKPRGTFVYSLSGAVYNMTMFQMVKTALKLMLGRGMRRSYGQFGEDAYIQSLFKHILKGTYVDVGSYHPVLYSNTYALYRAGWSGTAVDPNHAMQRLFRIFRMRDTFVHAAVGAEGQHTYYRFSDGAYNTFDATEAEARKKNPRLTFLGEEKISLRPLSSIINGRSIDFLNVDAEGKDVEILRSHDWQTFPKVIAVEDHAFDVHVPRQSEVYAYLVDKGYKLTGLCGPTLVFSRTP